MFHRIIIWHNIKENKYYFKKLKGYYNKYYVGMRNQYDHEVILIVDIQEFINSPIPLRLKIINKIIEFLSSIK